jgi:2-polyprenyl-3-methyl-5-hydroxy-6-metoxy-1,4-benzoquinol methylase
MVDLKEYTPGGVHTKILNSIEAYRRGLVLDVPSGQGALSKKLEDIGFKVILGDIERRNILYKNNRCVQLDLNNTLPFKGSIFDYIVCVEGVEHLENPHGLIREFAKVVKKDGYLIISTPNVMTVKSRLRFLFYSYLDFFKYFGPPPLDEEKHRIEEHEHQHLNPIFYGEMKFILEKYGFIIEKIETNRFVQKWNIIFPFMKWVIKIKSRKKFPKDPFYLSDTILKGEDLIFIAQKKE